MLAILLCIVVGHVFLERHQIRTEALNISEGFRRSSTDGAAKTTDANHTSKAYDAKSKNNVENVLLTDSANGSRFRRSSLVVEPLIPMMSITSQSKKIRHRVKHQALKEGEAAAAAAIEATVEAPKEQSNTATDESSITKSVQGEVKADLKESSPGVASEAAETPPVVSSEQITPGDGSETIVATNAVSSEQTATDLVQAAVMPIVDNTTEFSNTTSSKGSRAFLLAGIAFGGAVGMTVVGIILLRYRKEIFGKSRERGLKDSQETKPLKPDKKPSAKGLQKTKSVASNVSMTLKQGAKSSGVSVAASKKPEKLTTSNVPTTPQEDTTTASPMAASAPTNTENMTISNVPTTNEDTALPMATTGPIKPETTASLTSIAPGNLVKTASITKADVANKKPDQSQ